MNRGREVLHPPRCHDGVREEGERRGRKKEREYWGGRGLEREREWTHIIKLAKRRKSDKQKKYIEGSERKG